MRASSNISSDSLRSRRLLLTVGHAATDTCQAAVPALLPFLILNYQLSYTEAALIVLCGNLVSTVVQPLFGYLGDKVQYPWFMALGVAFGGVGVALMGFASAYPLLLLASFLAGLGAALFHPEGAKLANVLSLGGSKGKGISDFAVGGNLGYALGPLLVALLVPLFGMPGCTLFLIPTSAVTLLLLTQNSYYVRHASRHAQAIATQRAAGAQDDWQGFVRITIVNLFRSIVGSGMLVFVPLYWAHVFNQPESLAALMLTLYSGSGVIATFLGGRIADKLGNKRIVLVGYCLQVVALVGFLLAPDVFVAGVAVVLTSLALSLTYSPLVTQGQVYLPNHLGLSSGISLGVVVSMGGITTPILGYVGDTMGLYTSLVIIALCGIGGLTAALNLQRSTRLERKAKHHQ